MKILTVLLCLCTQVFCHTVDISTGVLHSSSDTASGSISEKHNTSVGSLALDTSLFSNFSGRITYNTSLNDRIVRDGSKLSFSDISIHIISQTGWQSYNFKPFLGLGVFSRNNRSSNLISNQAYFPFGLESSIYTNGRHKISILLQEDMFFFKTSQTQPGHFNTINFRTHLGAIYSYGSFSLSTRAYLSTFNTFTGGHLCRLKTQDQKESRLG